MHGAIRYVTRSTNTLKCMKVYYTHLITLTCFATHVAILRGVHYNGQIHQNITEVFELRRYTILNFENNVWFKIEDS
jgi:hypothetical protein